MAKNSISSYLHIGENLKRERKAAGYTQREFAQLLGIPVSTYSNYENGNRDPGPDTLKKIATTLNIPMESLLSVSDQLSGLDKPENRRLLNQMACELEIPAEEILRQVQNKENYASYPALDRVASILRNYEKKEAFAKIVALDLPDGMTSEEFFAWLISWFCEIMYRGIDPKIADKTLLALKTLNQEGQEKAVAYVEDLARIAEYRKPQKEIEKLHKGLFKRQEKSTQEGAKEE